MIFPTTTTTTVTQAEGVKLITALDRPEYMAIVQKEGIKLAGVHYMFLRHGR